MSLPGFRALAEVLVGAAPLGGVKVKRYGAMAWLRTRRNSLSAV
jgi:hypothetical protein